MNGQRFEGKIAVVTGGNSGIGLGTAKAYAREGASVAITGRDEKTLQTAAKEIGPGTLAIKSDVGKISDIENMVAAIRDKFGRIDALFLNAGIGQFMPLEQITEKFFRRERQRRAFYDSESLAAHEAWRRSRLKRLD